MKTLLITFLLFIATALPAHADMRIEIFGNYAHFQVDPANANNEVYATSTMCSKLQIEEVNGSYFGEAECVAMVDEPPWLKYQANYDPNNLPTFSGIAISGQACALVTANFDAGTGTQNQTQYNTNDSSTRFQAMRQPNGGYEVTYKLWCRNAN